MNFLPFAVPDIGEEEIAEVTSVLRSGWVTTGPKTRQFEQEFQQVLNDDIQCLAVNSATAGLHLCLEAIGIGPGDEVITTPYTFTATAEVIRYLGADPVFADIDPETRNITAGEIEKKITPRTKAIIPVHFAGLSCDMDPILELARQHHLRVIEDAAHAFPAYYRGKMIGTLQSDATVFSFYATKTITTGEGGMICTRDEKIANRCKIMRLHGISRDAFDRYHSKDTSWYYEIVAPGYKYNLSDIASALGLAQLKKAVPFRDRRAALARMYDEAFAGLPVKLPCHADPAQEHAWHLYAMQIDETLTKVTRNDFINGMKDLGIGCSVHFIPLHLHPYWRTTYSLAPRDYPNALSAYNGAVSLPLYTKMTDDDLQRVVDAARSILK